MWWDTLAGPHAAQSQLVRELDIRLGVTFDLVVQRDRVGPARVVSRGALDLRVGRGGHGTDDVVYGDGDELGVGAESRAGQRDGRAARPCGK